MNNYNKFVIILSLIFILILGVGFVSASQDINQTLESDAEPALALEDSVDENLINNGDNPQLTSSQKNFTEIQNLIDNAHDGDTIEITGNYVNLEKSYIEVNKSITLDGKGQVVLDGNWNCLFNVSKSNVKIVNCNFINLEGYYFGAIRWGADYGLIENCTFKDVSDTVIEWDGNHGFLVNCELENCIESEQIIRWNGNFSSIKSCRFVNASSHGQYGGTIAVWGTNLYLSNCTFINSSSNRYGGAICLMANNGTVKDSIFVNCSSTNGGAVTIGNPYAVVDNCTFLGCSGRSSGGAVYWGGGYGNLKRCEFKNCSSDASGGAVAWHAIDGSIMDCTFSECIAYNQGGTIYWGYSGGRVENCKFFNLYSPTTTSAIFWTGFNGILRNSTFVNCSSNYSLIGAGAVFFWGFDELVEKCSFVNCYSNDTAGALNLLGSRSKLSDVSFINCHAGVDGGALYCTNSTILNSTFVNCSSAVSGGSISTFSSCIISDCYFENSSAENGGTIFVRGNSETSYINNCHILNSSAENGGAIYIIDSRVFADKLIFSDVGCSNLGDIIYTEGYLDIKNSALLPVDLIGDRPVIYANNTDIMACDNWWGGNDNPVNLVSFDAFHNHDLSRWIVTDELKLENSEVLIKFNHLMNENGDLTDYNTDLPSFEIEASAVNGSFSNSKVSVENNIARFAFNGNGASDILTFTYDSARWYFTINQKSQIPTRLSAVRYYSQDASLILFNISLYDEDDNLISDSIVISIGGNRSYVGLLNGSVTGVCINNPDRDYSLLIKYEGNWKYLPSELRLSKDKPFASIESSEIYHNEDLIVTVNMLEGLTGTVQLKLTNETLSCDILHGKAMFTLPKLDAGLHNCIITYFGDKVYQGAENYTTFAVKKTNATYKYYDCRVNPSYTSFEIYGNDDLSGKLWMVINGRNLSSETYGTGSYYFDVTNIPWGTYNATLTYEGDKNYYPFTDNITVNFIKDKSKIFIHLDEVEYGQVSYRDYGEPVNLRVTFYWENTGEYIFKLNNYTFRGNISENEISYTFNFTDLMPGFYNCTVYYLGDDYFNETQETKLFVVRKANQTVDFNISVDDINYGSDAVVTVDVNATGNMTLIILNQTFTGEIKDGKAMFTIHNLSGGFYEINVTYPGNETHNDLTKRATFTVTNYYSSKSNVTLYVDCQDIVYGDNAIIDISLDSDATGNVSVLILNDTYIKEVVNGAAEFVFSNLNVGNYLIIVTYWGDDRYNEKIIKSNFTVNKATPNLEVIVYDTLDGDWAKYSVSINATGNVSIKSEPKSATFVYEIVNGTINGEFYESAGSYTAIFNYLGNENYNSVITEFNYTIHVKNPLKYDLYASLNVSGNHYGDECVLTFDLNGSAIGEAALYVGDVRYATNITNSQAIFKLSNLDINRYSAKFVYLGDEDFNGYYGTYYFDILHAEPIIEIAVNNITYGEVEFVTITLVKGAAVNYYLWFNNVAQEIFLNGTVCVNYTNLPAGEHMIYLTYQGTQYYYSTTIYKYFNVEKATPKIEFDVSDIVYGENQLINIASDYDLDLEVYVNGIYGSCQIVDGIGFVNLSGLDAGDYIVRVCSSGSNFNDVAVEKSFSVLKITPNVVFNVSDIVYGENQLINITLNYDWDLDVYVNGIFHGFCHIVEGIGFVNLSGLTAGNYTVRLNSVYPNFNPLDVERSFSVLKVTPNVTFDVSDVDYGDDVLIYVSSDIECNAHYEFAGKTYSITANSIPSYFNMTGLDAGKYDITIVFDKDENYETLEKTVVFNVNKTNPHLNINVENIEVGETAIVNIDFLGKANITLTIKNQTFSKNEVTGNCIFELDNLDVGNYTVTVNYLENVNYNSDSKSVIVFVSKKRPQISINAYECIYGGNTTVIVSVDGTGSVVLAIDGNNYTSELVGGSAAFIFAGLDAGTYDFEVFYSGDEIYDSATASASLTVIKAEGLVSVGVDDIAVGEVAVIVVNASGSGSVMLDVNGVNYTKNLVDGQAVFEVSGLDAGTYVVTVYYSGDSNYNPADVSNSFVVNEKGKLNSTMTVLADDITYGENATVIVSVDGTGSVVLAIGGNNYTSELVGGSAAFIFAGLDAGTYDFEVFYSGDETYESGYSSASLTVVKAAVYVTVDVDDIAVGEVAVIVVNASGSGSVILDVDGVNYTKNLVDGQAVFEVSGLDAGIYIVTVNYSGNGNYESASASNSFVVNEIGKLNSTVIVSADDVTYGENATVVVSVDGTGSVILTVGNSTFEENVTNGKAVFRIPGLDAGIHDLKLTYSGDDQYLGNSSKGTLTVLKANPCLVVAADSIMVGETLDVNVAFKDISDITLTIANQTFTNYGCMLSTVFNISDLKAGNYTLNVTYGESRNYFSDSKTASVFVIKKVPQIVITAHESVFGENATVEVKLDGTGSVVLSICDKNYTSEIVGGSAAFGIAGLNVGTYDFDVFYSGDETYGSGYSSASLVVVKSVGLVSVEVSNIDVGEVEVIVVDASGSGSVMFDVDGKNYTKVLVDGQAVFEVSGLDAGTYFVNVQYSGDANYEACVVPICFIVNELGKLNSTMTVLADDITYGENATVIVGVEGTGSVILTVGNSTFEENVINGQAVFKISGLDAGIYNLKLSYSGDDQYLGNSTMETLAVLKANPGLSVAVDSIVVGEVLTVNVVFNDISDITLTFANQTFTNYDCMLSTVFNISELKAGSYTLNVSYAESRNYFADSKAVIMFVNKKSPQMSISIYESAYGENATVIVNVDGTGSVVLAIDGSNYTSEIVGGSAAFEIAGLAVGTYDFDVFYSGDETYESGYSSASLNVVKAVGIVSVDVDDITVGEVAVIVVTASGSGSVMLDVDGANYTKALVDGRAVFEVSGLDAGTYVVTVYYSGDSNYNPADVSNSFVVNELGKQNSTITVSADNITYGENTTVIVGVEGTGTVILTVGNSTFEENVTDGQAVFKISGLDAGIYNLKVTYSGDDQYLGNSTMKTLTVLKANPGLSVAVDSIVVGEVLTVNVVFNDISDITLTIANQTFTNYNCMLSTVFNISNLKAGSYTLNVSYGESRNYFVDSKTVSVFVIKKVPQIAIAAHETVFGENATVGVKLDGTGSVVLSIGDKNYTSEIVGGSAAFEISGLDVGTYDFDVFYSGDEIYDSGTASASLTVIKAAAHVSVDVDDITVGEVAVIAVGASGSGSVMLDVNGANYTKNLVDGQAVFEVSGLDAGTYVVTVNYSGNENYEPAAVSNSFVVNEKGKLNSTMTVLADDIAYGENATVVVSVEGTGSVILIVGNSTFEENVTDGQAVFKISGLDAGIYDLKVTYSGDDQYLGNSTMKTLTVLKANPDLRVAADSIMVGETLTVNVAFNDISDITLTIANQTFTNYNCMLSTIFNISNLKAGSYTLNVTYVENKNYCADSKTVNVSVIKKYLNLVIVTSESAYGENAAVEVKLDGTGSVVLAIGGSNYTSDVVNGYAAFEIASLDAGTYDFEVFYSGDETYDSATASAILTVIKAAAHVSVDVDDITVGEVAVIVVNASGSGSVILDVDGANYTKALVGGQAVFEVSGLDAGTYVVTVNYSGDTNYEPNTASNSFVVNEKGKLNSTIAVSADDITYGETATVIVSVNGTGSVILTVGDSAFEENVVGGQAIFRISDLNAGSYDLKVTYSGDDQYLGNSTKGTLTVLKANPKISIQTQDVSYGQPLTVYVKANGSGNVILDINNRRYTNKSIENVAVFVIENLTAGQYLINANYMGDDNYLDANSSYTVNVNQISSNMAVNLNDISYGETLTVNVNLEGSGIVELNIGGNNYHATVNDGNVQFNITGLDAGSYDVNVIYQGDTNHKSDSSNKTVNVLKVAPSIWINSSDIDEGQTAVITVNVYGEGSVDLQINGEIYAEELKNNFAVFEIPNLAAGTYIANAAYSGDKNHLNATAATGFTVNSIEKANSTITVSQANFTYDENATITVEVEGTGNVTLTIANKTLVNDLTNHVTSFKLSGLDAGEYNAKLIYSGDDAYNGASKNIVVTVKKADPTLNVDVSDINYGENLNIKASLNAEGDVEAVLNNKSYSSKTHNGIAEFNVTGLDAGEYLIKLSYSGGKNYNDASVEKQISVFKINSSIEVAADDINYGESAVIIVNAEGTGTVNIKIQNDSYTGQIENGIVKFNVSNLNAGTYEFDVTYSGDINHNGNAAKDRLNVLKATPSVNVTVYNVSYGNVVVTVDVNAEGIIELTVANRSLKGTIESGKVNFNISDLSAGHYDVVARYLGDVNHNEKSSSSGFDVDKITATISHEVQNDTVAVILPGDATGTVTLIINNQSEISNVIGGIANIMIPDLENGNYTYVISYSGNEKYCSAISNGSLVINKSSTVTPEIVIPPLDILSEGAVSLPEDATGNITLSVAGEIYVFPVVNGVANISMPDLANGNYSYVISYSGDGKYSSFTQNGSVSVLKANPNLEVSVSDIDFGETAVVNIFINENVTGSVLVNVKTVSIVNGKASLNLSGLAAGNHTVNVTFAGDRRFVSDSKAVSFRVNKLAAVIAIDVLDSVVEGSDLTVNVAVPGATGVVVINGRQYALVNGAANVTFSNVEEGSFAIDVGYAGDDVYMDAHTSKVVTVYAKKDAGLTANDVKINVGDVAVIDIAVNRNITGKITVNGDEVEVVGGTAKYAVAGLAFGNYTYVIKFAGDKYFNADEKTVKITVNKIETPAGENPFDVDDNKTVESKTPTYSISLPADATGTLTVTIGDNIYTADVVNGTATVVITDMPAGNYEVKLNYSGDEKYSPIVKTSKATVKVNPKIVADDATVQYYAGKYYSVTVYGEDGKVAAGTPVTFALNGKKLITVNTASNGVARFKVTQTPVTKGNLEVSALKVSVTKKLTIQRVIVLKKVAIKKSAKKIYLTATLKKVNGKYLKNKKITFKFKGKKVGTVKTNSKGVAKILLKTSFYKNLKTGSKVTYTATYVKDTVKQTVKIKK